MPLVCQRDPQELEKGSLTARRNISFMISCSEYQEAWVKIVRKFSILNKRRKGEKMRNLLNSTRPEKRSALALAAAALCYWKTMVTFGNREPEWEGKGKRRKE